MADAVISCWDAKYEFSFWRPVTGIREAANDGNPDTAADAGWTPLLVTPNFPAYTSGHSTVSGAAAAVLADFFGTDNVAYTLPSQNPAIAARSYTSFSQAAAESAVSRLYGGIHWSFDNNVGLTAGTAVGEYVVANFLRPVERDGGGRRRQRRVDRRRHRRRRLAPRRSRRRRAGRLGQRRSDSDSSPWPSPASSWTPAAATT